jgi:hypothetical protein
MKIGWNPVTQSWDKLYTADFWESQRYNTPDIQNYNGRKNPLDPNRHKKGDVWEEETEKVYFYWEDNS